ncbi:hypothetical protein NZ698_14860 [Chryseobacterium sp. PBS4-4]|uniref:DUF3990 domain-containing protein n=1 Tax=Chryseobacterium edaphi TaxID=2976532 RepID=A0ABT2W917_9FLAO|nr:hypothetical protein [Chryseobacterium edaphi]MCU7618479.1 hypothetical protein [Chryseobacterium edaphi]
MYTRRSGLILGFHGCDKSIRDKVVNESGFMLKKSENDYDWLGHGIYFWENNHERALHFAEELRDNPKSSVTEPAVLGAVIDLGACLDLLDSKFLKEIKISHDLLCDSYETYGLELPKNIKSKTGELLARKLDCAVIQSTHALNVNAGGKDYDSVRGVFFEGEDLYENAGFKQKNHIQIAIRNQDCIKGFFIPREF